MNDLDQFKQTYFQECEELLADLEEHLLTLQSDGSDIEALHAVFRAVHSIKGGAGAFGFDRLVSYAHIFETMLDMMRDGVVEVSPDNVELSVRGADVLADLVRAAQSGTDLPEGQEAELAAAFRALAGTEEEAPGGEDDDGDDFDDLDFEPVMVGGAAPPAAVPEPEPEAGEVIRTYHIRFDPHSEMLQRANEPLLLIRELKTIGAVTARADLSALPSLADIQPEDAYIKWTIDVITAAEREQIEEVFEFVIDDCELEITVDEPEAAPAAPPMPEPEPEPEVEAAPPPPSEPKAEKPEKQEPSPAPAKAAPPKEAPASAPPARTVNSIRVDLEKLDRMVNMVGELVITQAMLTQQGDLVPQDQFPDLVRGLEELSQHTRELQDNVMAMRAQPVKTVFSRIPRLVRELSAQVGKKVNLVMRGENTEIDKTVIEQLSDPLTHMIRNSVDHGLEGPDERLAAGKSAEGTVVLSAEHRGGRIVIEIQDDGRGINRDKVLQKAIEKGLVAPNSVLSEEEIDNLIFAPGFSTAESVSNISGRGVGMDVVLRNIQNLGGRVMVRSVPGQGSCFSMTLPLTLAVLDGMIVKAGDQSYVIPLAVIVESLRPLEDDIHNMAGEKSQVVMGIRGEYIPLVFLHRMFGIDGAVDEPWKALVVVAETEGGGKIGVVVDEILGQQQVVIKSLEENFDHIDGIAAATILGSGKVALILDVMGLKHLAQTRPAGPRVNKRPRTGTPPTALAAPDDPGLLPPA